jgi:hypothetical protein
VETICFFYVFFFHHQDEKVKLEFSNKLFSLILEQLGFCAKKVESHLRTDPQETVSTTEKSTAHFLPFSLFIDALADIIWEVFPVC